MTTQSLPVYRKEAIRQRDKDIGIRYCVSAPAIGNSSVRPLPRSRSHGAAHSGKEVHRFDQNKILGLRPSVENKIKATLKSSS